MLTLFLLYRQVSNNSPAGKTKASQQSVGRGPLVGSLVDSFDFKEDGLVKKTISIKVQDVQHHLVSYYSLDDANNLPTPRDDHLLKDLRIRESLLYQPRFRNHLDDDGTWSLAGSMAPNIPVVPGPQYDPFGRLYLIPRYQVPMQQCNAYQCD